MRTSSYTIPHTIHHSPLRHTHITGGVTLRVFSPPGRAEQGRFALDVGVRSLDFYDDFFKVW
ncbi:hypothetical protein EON63_03825 [archaeon]|nr:MAG: hypothetical protein EON63_03825 [archaeon]